MLKEVIKPGKGYEMLWKWDKDKILIGLRNWKENLLILWFMLESYSKANIWKIINILFPRLFWNLFPSSVCYFTNFSFTAFRTKQSINLSVEITMNDHTHAHIFFSGQHFLQISTQWQAPTFFTISEASGNCWKCNVLISVNLLRLKLKRFIGAAPCHTGNIGQSWKFMARSCKFTCLFI